MKLQSRLLGSMLLAILTLLALSNTNAQTATTGQIAGAVTDVSGAVVPNASIVAKLEGGGQQYNATSDDQGYFTVAYLRPGNYEVVIQAKGFAAYTAQHVVVEVTQSTRVAAQLAPQGEKTTVRVSAEAPVLDTTDPTEGRVIDSLVVRDLPLPTRNFQQLLALSPGTNAALTISTELGRGDIDLNVNGQPGTSNNVIIDGIYANSIGTDSTPNLSVPTPDAIQEFIVQTLLYDATTGRNTGGNVALVTKSGSNSLHGAAYGFLRATGLNANDFLSKRAGLPRGTDNRNVFGGALGGPILRDKTFFFLSYQGQREQNEICLTSCTFVDNIPSLLTNDRSTATLTAMAASYGAPLLNPTSLALLQAKLPNGHYAIPSAGNGQAIGGTVSTLLRGLSTYHDDQFNSNFDHNFSDRDHFSGKFFFENSPEFQANSFFPAANTFQAPGFGSQVDFYNRLLSLNETHVFSASWINDARFGLSRIRAFTAPQEPFSNAQFGISNPLAAQFPGMSTIAVAGLFTLGSEPLANEQSVVETFQASDYLTWRKGRHTFRFGGDVFRNHTDFYFNFFSRGEILTDQTSCAVYGPGCSSTAIANFDQFLDGGLNFTPSLIPLDPIIGLLGNGVRNRHLRSTDGDLFLQDDIHLTSGLTVNLGVRVSEFGGISDTKGQLANFDPRVFLANNTTPCHIAAPCEPPGDGFRLVGGNLNSSLWNAAPRVGFAWQALGNKSLVVRGGYGIYHDRFSSRLANLQILNYPYGIVGLGLGAINAPFPNLANVTFPLTPQVPSSIPFYFYGVPLTGILQTPISGYYVAPNFTAPYDQQYALGFQYEPFHDWVLEVGYVGSKERKGINVFTINQTGSANASLLTASGFSSNKAFNGLEEAVNSGKANYNSLQASLTKRFDKHLQFLASYTYSHSLDNGSEGQETELAAEPGDQQNFATQYASSDFDRKHRFVFSGLYDFADPYRGDSRVFKALVNGWQVSSIMTFQGGAPFSVLCSAGSALNSRANYVGGSYTTPGGTESRLDNYINLAAFSCPVSTVPGSGQGPAVNLPPFGDSGRNIVRGPGQKNIDFSVSKHFPIREVMNLEFRGEFFNTLNWANFGQPNNNLFGGSPGAIRVLGSGPRVVQLALKLHF